MAEQPNEAGGPSTPMTTKANLQDVSRRLDQFFTMVSNSPLFKTPVNPRAGETVLPPLVNPRAAPNEGRAASHHTEIENAPQHSARGENSRRRSRSECQERSTRIEVMRGEYSEGEASSGAIRREETGYPLAQYILDEPVPEVCFPNLECYEGKTDLLSFLPFSKDRCLSTLCRMRRNARFWPEHFGELRCRGSIDLKMSR